MLKFRPILGAGKPRGMTDEEFFAKVKYPVIATPKLDGIRCITLRDGIFTLDDQQCLPVCRSLDPVPNEWIFRHLALKCPPGLDGEILSYAPATLLEPEALKPFYQIQSDVMSVEGTPHFKFHIFDYHDFSEEHPHLDPYAERLHKLATIPLPIFCEVLEHKVISSREELEAYEAEQVGAGHEGICWRHLAAPYKYGRSTLREQALVKMKRFITAEARIIGSYELMHNDNPACANALGYAERSSHRENMRPSGLLGGFWVEDLESKARFKVGSGFTMHQRTQWWPVRESLVGQLVTYKCQPHGQKELPRIPVFIALRDRRDM